MTQFEIGILICLAILTVFICGGIGVLVIHSSIMCSQREKEVSSFSWLSEKIALWLKDK